MILFLNTADPEKIQLALKFSQLIFRTEFGPEFNQTELLVAKIDGLFKKAKKSPLDLTGVVAMVGPGHFTCLRTGIAVANTLAYALNIPIIGITASDFSSFDEFIQKGEQKLLKQKSKKFLNPFYGKEPNITLAKVGFKL